MKNFKRLGKISIVFFIFSAFSVPALTAQTYYMANISNYSQKAAVTINGYPLISNSAKDSSSFAAINPWIWKGTNTIKIHLDARESSTSPSLTLTIQKQSADGKSSDILQFVYPAKNADGKSENPVYPFDKTLSFELVENSPSDFWSEAEPITLDDASKDAAAGIVLQLFDAIVKKDIKKIHELKDYQLKDIAKMYNQGKTEEISKSLDESIDESLKSKDFKPVPFKKEDLVFILLDNGKVIKVTKNDGSNPINFGNLSMDVFIGKVKGKYFQVR
jgi:hypothetical protein